MNRIRLSAVAFALFIFFNACIASVILAAATLTEALALVEQGSHEQATQQLESLLRTAPSEAREIHHVLAYCYEKQQKWTKAIEHYLQVVPNAGGNVGGYDLADYAVYRLAESYMAVKNYPDAVIWYQHLVDGYPQSFRRNDAKYKLAVAYQAQKQHARALSCFSLLIADTKSGYVRQSIYESAASHEALGNWREAHRLYQQLIDANDGDRIARNALEHIQRLSRTHPGLPITREHRMSHGVTLYNQGKYKEARVEFRAVVAGHSDELAAQATYHIGRSYFRQQEYDLAVKAYDEIISRYPGSDYLTRALYQKTICLRRKGQAELAEKQLKAFIKDYEWSALADDALYDLGVLQESQRRYDEAIETYRLLTRKYQQSDFVPEAYWRIGWMQFKNRRYAESIETFTLLMKLFPKNAYAEAAHFWAAKGYERQNDWETAAKIYIEIVSANHWYYSSRAREQLKNYAVIRNVNVDSAALAQPRVRVIADSASWKNVGAKKTPRVEKLMRLKLFEDAITELEGVSQLERSDLKDDHYNLIVCLQKLGKFQEAHIYADRLSKFQSARDENQAMPLELYQLLYPVHYNDVIGKHSRQYEIDPLFVASMIREESRYNAGIVSWAGARGLMQIMPSTGSDLARRLNIRRFSSDMLFDPDVNIQMGTWYMKDLMNRFQNNHALVAGAYNGGPGRMQRWVSSMDTSDLDEFIEDIPITETRRHIKKVLDSYYIYQELYGNSDLLSTEKL